MLKKEYRNREVGIPPPPLPFSKQMKKKIKLKKPYILPDEDPRHVHVLRGQHPHDGRHSSRHLQVYFLDCWSCNVKSLFFPNLILPINLTDPDPAR